MFWEQVTTDGDVYYDLWKKFWGKALDFEPDVTVASVADDKDDEESMAVNKPFKVLTIGTGLSPQLDLTKGRLIVCQEYLDALVSLNEEYEAWPETGAIVIGHPGIGKSWFLYYLLVLRLSEKKKTILNLDASDPIRLFDSSGYYKFRREGDIDDFSERAHDAWALLDTNIRKVMPHPFLTSPRSPVFMVFPCSPNLDRYSDYRKQNEVMYYVMDNWTFDEIWAGATLRPAGKVDQKMLHDYFTRYGPSPKTMYDLYDGDTKPKVLDDTIYRALRNITPEHLKDLLSEAKGYLGPPSDKSHAVILVSPHPETRALLHGEIITHHVFQLIAERLFKNDILALVRTYKLFSNADIAHLSITCGWLFDYYCHHMLFDEHDGH